MSLRRQIEQELGLPSEQVDVFRACALLEQLRSQKSDREALALGEEFLPQIIQAFVDKATATLELILEPVPLQSDPAFEIEWLYPFMRRFQYLDISHLLGRRENDYPEERQAVAFVELTADEREAYIREPVVVDHSEDVAQWSEAIRHVLDESATFVELLEVTELTQAELTLGVLLGEFWVEQRSDKFYDPGAVVVFVNDIHSRDRANIV